MFLVASAGARSVTGYSIWDVLVHMFCSWTGAPTPAPIAVIVRSEGDGVVKDTLVEVLPNAGDWDDVLEDIRNGSVVEEVQVLGKPEYGGYWAVVPKPSALREGNVIRIRYYQV